MTVERAIARAAGGQNGAATWAQLRAAGLTGPAIGRRVAGGTLFHVFYRVYTVADPSLLALGRETAALLSVGRQAVLSHRAAAAAWGLAPPDRSEVDVTLVGRRIRPRAGIRIHHAARLDPADIRRRFNIRLTAPARTLIDFATQATGAELEEAFGEARAKGLLKGRDLERALERAPRGHAGAALVRSRLAGDAGSTYTRSKAERRLRALLKGANLPQPLVNVPLHGFTVDFLWPDLKLIVEVDGFGTHGDRIAFERDRRRDQVHVAAGYAVVRITWRQLCDEPLVVIARLAQALAQRAA